MEKFEIKEDIRIIYVKADSFPMGVGEAFKKLSAALGEENTRQLYGISNPDDKGKIVYRAGAEESRVGEAEEKGLETFLVKKGIFISVYLKDWKKDESSIGSTFKQLLSYPGIDPEGYCLEMYQGDNDVRCLVPLK